MKKMLPNEGEEEEINTQIYLVKSNGYLKQDSGKESEYRIPEAKRTV